jgi:hypothetical protein
MKSVHTLHELQRLRGYCDNLTVKVGSNLAISLNCETEHVFLCASSNISGASDKE